MVIGFAVLSFVTVKTYSNAPPIQNGSPTSWTRRFSPATTSRPDRTSFLKYALMEHGTLWGHGAYLGPDYSAEYLHRLTEIMRDAIAGDRFGRAFAALEMGAAAETWSSPSAR